MKDFKKVVEVFNETESLSKTAKILGYKERQSLEQFIKRRKWRIKKSLVPF